MKFIRYLLLKIRDVFVAEFYWFTSRRISIIKKIVFVCQFLLNILSKKKHIYFLSADFSYEHIVTPLLLGMYPREVLRILRAVPYKDTPLTVLDIGANIGQWARAFLYYNPAALVDSFEPNSTIKKILLQNASAFRFWRIFPYGIGKHEKQSYLYFNPYATDGGTYISNCKDAFAKRVKTVLFPLTKKYRKKYVLPDSYDIVKIDVEGMEADVLEGLASLNFGVLSIEVDTGRGYGVKESDILYILNTKQKRNMVCIGVYKAHRYSPEGNALFVKKHI